MIRGRLLSRWRISPWLALLRQDREPDERSEPAEAPEAPAPAAGEIDAAESRWDPWLLALARTAAQEEARPN